MKHNDMTYGTVTVNLHAFLSSALGRDEGVSFTSQQPYPREKIPRRPSVGRHRARLDAVMKRKPPSVKNFYPYFPNSLSDLDDTQNMRFAHVLLSIGDFSEDRCKNCRTFLTGLK